ncbi:YbaB/EbfC family nucleoid-associated protein [Streptomyces sp. NPDC050617]|uniref:YbaB/EbfC family nucleoid-associated protein n=1 Tax=Streptomyces sp. NPDC050617 TaxID=3154628 RepID=UPI00342C63D2
MSIQEQLEAAMADLANHTQRIQELQKNLAETRTSVTSRDRMVTVTLTARGEIAELKFNTEDYRSMPRAQLATVLTTTLNEARAKMTSQVSSQVRPLMGEQTQLAEGMFGGHSMDELLAPLRARRPEGLEDLILGTPPKSDRTRDDEEEFDG